MLNFILKYLRFALLGVAMAFLINPYAYAIENIPPHGDLDQDTIPNISDVCYEDSYNIDEHIDCLSCAGVVVIGIGMVGSDVLKRRAQEFFDDPSEDGNVVIEWMITVLVEQFFAGLGFPTMSWENLNIATCADLTVYERSLDKFSRKLKRLSRILGAKIPFIRDPTSEVRRVLSMLALDLAYTYEMAYINTHVAYNELCARNRLNTR